MTDNIQPEAMDLADWLEAVGGGPSAKRCAALLREQHARIAELEAQLKDAGAASVLEDAASAGFFLQLPQRPKPEAPAGTIGLDWDAYSGAQMLAYGRDCSNTAIVAAQKPGGL